jgi:REP-associated tyrosine transposase
LHHIIARGIERRKIFDDDKDHHNPLRAGLVKDLEALTKYPFSGHRVIVGKHQQSWQHSHHDGLARFGKQVKAARNRYNASVTEGADQGKRADLTGGGLIRSTGGRAAVNGMRKANVYVNSDERIVGDGDVVAQICVQANEVLDKKYALRAEGMDLQRIAERVAEPCDMPVDAPWLEGCYRSPVIARSLLCFWAVRELGISMTSLARELKISAVAVSKSVQRGA